MVSRVSAIPIKGRSKKKQVTDQSVTFGAPPRKAKPVSYRQQIFFFIIIRYSYQKMQNGLKRRFFMKYFFGGLGKNLVKF